MRDDRNSGKALRVAVSPATPREARWNVGEVLGLLVLLTLAGLWGFEVRPTLYFDEIINTAKANRGLVFDYALRPLYYSVNIVSVELFGESVESLRLASLLMYLATGLLLFRTGLESAGRWCAWMTATAYGLSQTVLVHGIRGMPHVPAGLLVTISLFCLLGSENRTHDLATRWRWGFGAAGFALLAAATHITALAYLGSLVLWSTGAFLLAGRRSRNWADSLRSPPAGILTGLTSIVAVGVAMLGIDTLVDLLDSLLRGIRLVQDESRYSFNHADFTFYGRVLFSDPPLLCLLVVTALVTLAAALLASRRLRHAVSGSGSGAGLVLLLFSTLSSLLVISMLGWKFERVLVAFIPLVALTGSCWAATAIFALVGRDRRWRWIMPGAAGLMAVAGFYALAGTGNALEASRQEPAKTHARFTEVLANVVPGDAIGYIGDRSFDRATNFGEAGGKRVVALEPLERLIANPATLETMLHDRGLEFLVVDFETGSPLRSDVFWEQEFVSSSFDEVYEHRDRLLLWRLVPRFPSGPFGRALRDLPRGELVGVLGREEELGAARARWVESLLSNAGLRGYRLYLYKPAHAQFSFVPVRGLRHVILVPPPGDQANQEDGIEANLDEFRRSIIAAGGTLVAEEERVKAELWNVPADPSERRR